jgi:hypothetical protein
VLVSRQGDMRSEDMNHPLGVTTRTIRRG